MAKRTQITYKISETDKDRIEFAKIALQNNLYHEGWTFQMWLSEMIRKHDESSQIILAYDGNFAIGLCILKYYGQVGFYVNPHYRRMGIGTKLAELARSKSVDLNWDFYAGKGESGSHEFFEWVGIPHEFTE